MNEATRNRLITVMGQTKMEVPQVARICVTRNPDQFGFTDRFVAFAFGPDGLVLKREIGITENRAKKKARRAMEGRIAYAHRFNASIDNMKCEPF